MDREKTILSTSSLLKGRYRIIRTLGHGGMGVVYQALDENLKCFVAVKETFATDGERELRRAFQHEAHLLANIRHPAFPRVTDYFEQGDGLFFVMDFIDGDDLGKRLELMGRPFGVGEVLKWADRLLSALAELHAVNPPIVHKDIKPLNIKLCDGEVYLLDFGLAKGAFGQMSTVQSQDYSHLHGHTPHFSSPEQRARTGTSPRSDLYSLGATLWCLLTCQLPPDAMLRSVSIGDGGQDPLRPAHELNPEVPPAVSAVLEQAMSMNTLRRPEGAAEMRAALREAVEAPLRARAERERAEADERLRREAEAVGRAAEAEAARRLAEERAAHAAELRRLAEEHAASQAQAREETARVHTVLEEVTNALKDEVDRSNTLTAELNEARKRRLAAEAALIEEKRLRRELEEAFTYLEGELKENEAELTVALRAKGWKKRADTARQQLRDSLTRKDSLLRAAEVKARALTTERDAAVASLKSAEHELKRLEAEQSGRRARRSKNALLAASGLMISASVLGLLVWALGLFSTPAVTLSSDKLRASIGGVELETVRIPGGSFLMGSADNDAERGVDEKPQHQVSVQSFNIGKYEVTQAQWSAVAKLPKIQMALSDSPSSFAGPDLPVESVSWDEATEFCARLSKATGLQYRLPTEAEWEYAARGGSGGPFNGDLDALSWNANNSGKQPMDATKLWQSLNGDNAEYAKKLVENDCHTHPVGLKRPNAFGLYDTLGNVWEWCLDTWHGNYKDAPADGTAWTNGGDSSLHVCRGGSWFNSSGNVDLAVRDSGKTDGHYRSNGFRVVSVAQQ